VWFLKPSREEAPSSAVWPYLWIGGASLKEAHRCALVHALLLVQVGALLPPPSVGGVLIEPCGGGGLSNRELRPFFDPFQNTRETVCSVIRFNT
jgi:hypothetical protein